MPAQSLRVLLVEGDPDLARVYRLRLELDAYTVRTAKDGQEAITQARRSAPDLVFLDLVRAQPESQRFIEEMRAQPRLSGIPVILLRYEDEELPPSLLPLRPHEHVWKLVGSVPPSSELEPPREAAS
jgi:two-component system alkaline phosphatase synthesis response regulator PhoP